MVVDIEVFWHNDATREAKAAGVPFKITDCDRKVVTFYSISYTAPYMEGGKHYTNIYSDGDQLTSTLPPEKIKALIERARIQEAFQNILPQ